MRKRSLYGAIDRREALRSAALFVLLLAAAFYNVVFLGESLIPGNGLSAIGTAITPEHYGPHSHPQEYFDARGVYPYANIHDPGGSWWQGEPGMELLQRSLWRGEFPLWDPYVGGGVPSMANLLPAYWYPPSFLVALCGNAPWMKNLLTLALLFVSGFFTYVFLRKHQLSALASRAGGIAFMFSGAIVQTAPEFIGQAVSGIPIVLATTACLLHRPTWRRTLLTSAVWAMVSLASFPAVLVFAFGLAVLYAATVIAFDRGGAARTVLLTRFAVAAVLALSLVAFYYVPAAHLIRNSRFVAGFYHDAGLEHIAGREMYQLFSPALLSGAVVYMAFPPAYGNLFYFGVSGLLLAAATFGRGRPFPLLLFQALTAIWVLKLLGIQPVQWLGKLPILSSMHIANYGGILLGFMLAICAGLSVELVLQQKLRWWSVAGGIVLIAAGFVGLLQDERGNLANNPQAWRWEADYRLAVIFFALAGLLLLAACMLRRPNASRAIGLVIVALLAVEGVTNAAFPRQVSWNYWDHPPPYLQKLIATRTLGRVLPLGMLSANANSPYAIGSVNSLFVFNSDRYAELHRRYLLSNNEPALRDCKVIPADSVLDAFAVDRILIVSGDRKMILEAMKRGFPLLYADQWALLFGRPSAPRFFLTRDYAVATPDDAFYRYASRPSRRLLLEQAPGFPADPQYRGGTVQVLRFGLNSYRLRVSSTQPALLSASETNFPGWTARVNGRKTPILAANYAFRAIPVPAGASTVDVSYWPPGMTEGLVISAIALLIALAIAISAARGEHDPFAGIEGEDGVAGESRQELIE